jgi:hypothetical protein
MRAQACRAEPSSTQRPPAAAAPASLVKAQPLLSLEGFSLLPADLQSLILAHSAAPLHTCQASAVIRQDPKLSVLWLLKAAAARLIEDPFKTAVKLQWWSACLQLLNHAEDWEWSERWDYAVYHAAEAGQAQVVQQLLGKWACHRPLEDPWAAKDKFVSDTYLTDLKHSE